MRVQPQAVNTRLLTVVPGRRWSTRVEQANQRRRVARQERLEVIVRLDEERRQGRRSGAYVPDLLFPW